MTVGGAHLSGGTSTGGGGAGDFDDVTGLGPHPLHKDDKGLLGLAQQRIYSLPPPPPPPNQISPARPAQGVDRWVISLLQPIV